MLELSGGSYWSSARGKDTPPSVKISKATGHNSTPNGAGRGGRPLKSTIPSLWMNPMNRCKKLLNSAVLAALCAVVVPAALFSSSAAAQTAQIPNTQNEAAN